MDGSDTATGACPYDRGMSFLRRQVITTALTANAIRPVPGFRAGIPAFFAGWLTGELAPHVLAVTTADALAHATGRRRDVRGLALAGASAAGLAYLIAQARQVGTAAEDALVEGLGADYVEQLDSAPTPADLAVPWRKLVYPFRMREPRVTVHKDIAYDDETGRRGLLDVYVPAETPLEGARCCCRCTVAGGPSARRTSRGSRSCSTWPRRAGCAWRSTTAWPRATRSPRRSST